MAPCDRKGIKKFENARENGKLRVHCVHRLPNPSGMGIFLLSLFNDAVTNAEYVARYYPDVHLKGDTN
jgi:hypothetical protein